MTSRAAARAAPFVSYAQNFEDVILWRALSEVTHGFYVDVGAGSPIDDSVTLAFYERGWRGINVEPGLGPFHQLTANRPRDVNLRLALGASEGVGTLMAFGNAGLSTLEPSVAAQRMSEGHQLTEESVDVRTLDHVWSTHIPPAQPVHFLKVDVEGSEREVLLGNDWSIHRPWILVVEATEPQGQIPSHERWEHTLTDARYQMVYEDGLNRFYLAHEQQHLAGRFRYPPNVFDNFVVHAVAREHARATAAEDDLSRLYTSGSWRITAPLRTVKAWWRVVAGWLSRRA